MAIASYIGSQLNENTNTFQDWLTRTNSLISDMGSIVISIGDNNIGDIDLTGSFSANTIVGINGIFQSISGGTANSSTNLEFSSNVDFNYTADFKENVLFSGNTVTINSTNFDINTEISIYTSASFISSNSIITITSNTITANTLTIISDDFFVTSNSTFTGNNVSFSANTTVTIEGEFIYLQEITFTDVIADTITANTITAIDFNSTSDLNLKKDIRIIQNGLDIINNLNPVSFKWKSNDELSYGLIAQEVEKILPTIISENNEGIKSISYIQLISFLIAAIQEQDNRIRLLEQKI